MVASIINGVAASSPYIGINVYSPSTYDPSRPLADAMHSSGDKWKDVDYNNDAPADANGWPLSDGTVMLWENLDGNQGTYKLIFNGQATVSQQFNYFSFSNIVYDQATNTTTMDALVTDQGKQNCIIKFTNTKRTPSSPTNSGVTNVKLMRPTSPGASTSYSFDELYTSQYKYAISKYSVFRFMAGTNANSSVTWSDRTRANENSQNKVLPDEGSEANGMSWEYKIALCNEMNKDMWICIPLNANNDYIQKLVDQLKNGTTLDGKFYPGLEPELKLYVELSNELWNFGGADFKQATQLLNIAKAEAASGNSTINYDGESNDGVLRFRQQAKRTKEISDYFRAGFGDNQMMTRVRPLLEFQYANYNSSALIPLEFLNNYYNNADGNHVSNPHPVNYYLYGAGGATYYQSNNDGAETVDGIFNSGIPNNEHRGILEGEAVWPRAYGLKNIAYEGGMGVGGDRTSGARKEARSDPRAKAAEVASFNIFRESGGDLYVFGTYAQWEDIYNSDASPLQQGVDQINATTAPSPTFGTLVNASSTTIITSQSVDLSPGGVATVAFNNNNIMQGYVYRIETAGDYQIKLRVGNVATGGKIAVYVDGILKNTIDVPNTGSNTADMVVGSFNLGVGQHGVLVKPVAAPASSTDRTARMLGVVFVPNGIDLNPNPTPGPTPSSLVVRARGINTGVNLTVDIMDAANATGGTVQQTQTITNISTNYTDHTFNFTGQLDANKIRVRFTNDNNNDLEVDYISVNGTIYQTEATRTYSIGNWNAGTNGCSNAGYYGVTVLHCNGYFQYNLNGSSPQPTPVTTTYISDLTWSSALAGYGNVQKDKSVDGNTIKLNGTIYNKGLGTHSQSTIIYNLGGNYNNFLSEIGLDDEVDAYSCGLVKFEVYLDNSLAFSSSTKGNTTTTESINLNVSGKNELKLIVTEADNGNGCDHADWANARVTSSGSSARSSATETINASQISIYPNPANGIFSISIPEGSAQVEISDIQGSLILTKTVTGTQSFDATAFKTGVFIVKVSHSSGVTVKKLVIE